MSPGRARVRRDGCAPMARPKRRASFAKSERALGGKAPCDAACRLETETFETNPIDWLQRIGRRAPADAVSECVAAALWPALAPPLRARGHRRPPPRPAQPPLRPQSAPRLSLALRRRRPRPSAPRAPPPETDERRRPRETADRTHTVTRRRRRSRKRFQKDAQGDHRHPRLPAEGAPTRCQGRDDQDDAGHDEVQDPLQPLPLYP